MKIQTWQNPLIDKTTWGGGPWQKEPDKAQWVDEVTNLDCLIVRNPLGALCGYVGVPPGHPFHGKHYSDLEDADKSPSVHGGLTFAKGCSEDPSRPMEARVCHVPLEGRPDDVWWFGFDCAHMNDFIPEMASTCKELGLKAVASLHPRSGYRTIEYVKRECAILALQLHALRKP